MLMSYVGTLKTLLLWPVFRRFGTGGFPIRESSLTIGAVSIWWFYLAMQRGAGNRAALIGCAALASDSLYLLTSTFDWGPVALQHFLIAAGVYGWMRFFYPGSSRPPEPAKVVSAATGRRLWLAAGSFCFGLALWDKALAVWVLGGLALATILLANRQKLAAIGVRGLAISAVALSVGALPLLIYNVHTRGATLRENAGWTASQFPQKLNMLRITANGAGLLGYLTAEDRNTPVPHPVPAWAASLPSIGGSLTAYAFALALLLAPLAGPGARRGIAFCLIALLVAWLAMALNPNAGNAIHHTILLWPLPQAIIGISFAAASRRLGSRGVLLAGGATAVLCVSCILMTAEYYRKAVRNGGTPIWSAAVSPLSESIGRSGAQVVYAMDWGILDPVRLLERNRPLMRNGINELNREMVTGDSHLFITHAPSALVIADSDSQAAAVAASFGYRPEVVQIIPDAFGREVFEVYRWTR